MPWLFAGEMVIVVIAGLVDYVRANSNFQLCGNKNKVYCVNRNNKLKQLSFQYFWTSVKISYFTIIQWQIIVKEGTLIENAEQQDEMLSFTDLPDPPEEGDDKPSQKGMQELVVVVQKELGCMSVGVTYLVLIFVAILVVMIMILNKMSGYKSEWDLIWYHYG